MGKTKKANPKGPSNPGGSAACLSCMANARAGVRLSHPVAGGRVENVLVLRRTTSLFPAERLWSPRSGVGTVGPDVSCRCCQKKGCRTPASPGLVVLSDRTTPLHASLPFPGPCADTSAVIRSPRGDGIHIMNGLTGQKYVPAMPTIRTEGVAEGHPGTRKQEAHSSRGLFVPRQTPSSQERLLPGAVCVKNMSESENKAKRNVPCRSTRLESENSTVGKVLGQ